MGGSFSKIGERIGMNELGNRQKRLSVPRALLLMTAGPVLLPLGL